MEKYDVIIIGAGPAGMTAAVYAARANMNTLMLDALAPGGNIVNTNEIANYLGTGVIAGADLAIQMFEQTGQAGARFDYKTVTGVEDNGKTKVVVCKEDDASYEAPAIIIATGTKPRRLHVPGEDAHAGSGISWCAICDGAQYKGRDVVVIGGGNSAVEESIYLAGITRKLTIITMLDLTADPSACDKLRTMPNVEIYPWQDVIEFTGSPKLEGVRFKPNKEEGPERFVSCDGVFEYIGLEPTAGFCKNLGIGNDYGFIEVDSCMRTRKPGIFAAGDITAKHLRQVATACGDGALAGHFAAAYVEKNRQ